MKHKAINKLKIENLESAKGIARAISSSISDLAFRVCLRPCRERFDGK